MHMYMHMCMHVMYMYMHACSGTCIHESSGTEGLKTFAAAV